MTQEKNPDDIRMSLASHDAVSDRLEDMKALFPEVFVEGKVDLERLRQHLGDFSHTGTERFGLTWAGKAEAIRALQIPSHGTLVPMRKESVNFDESENMIIEGDNLEVLKLLQKSYHGKIKMIYIDPPYNTGGDFIYPDNFKEGLDTYLKYSGQATEEGFKATTNAESNGRYHSNWLNMLYPRLFMAKNLLRDDGVIFVSIDDHEAPNLRMIMNEIFGEENFIAQLIWNSEGHTDNQFDIKIVHEYVFVYARSSAVTLGHVVDPNTRLESNLWKGFAENSITKNGPANPPSEVLLPKGFPCSAEKINLGRTNVSEAFFDEIRAAKYISRSATQRHKVSYPIRLDSMTVTDGQLEKPCMLFSGWANVNKLKLFIANGCVPLQEPDGDKISFYLSENGVIYYKRERSKARNILSVLKGLGTTEKMRADLEAKGIYFDYPKPFELIKYLVSIGAEEQDSIILDFFAGSGTTAQAVLEKNKEDFGSRKFVLVQLPEPTDGASEARKHGYKNIFDIAAKRLGTLFSAETDAPLSPQNTSSGFKTFRLVSSNFKLWDVANAPKDVESLAQTLELFADNVLPDRSQEDILYEVILKSGQTLTAKIEKITIAGQQVFSIDNGAMLVCLEDPIEEATLRGILDLKPAIMVALDKAFHGNDQLKTNIKLQAEATGESEQSRVLFKTV